EVIKFDGSYKAPPEETAKDKGLAGEVSSSTKKKERTVAIIAEDMQKRKNDVKARTNLLLALPDKHQDELDTMSLDDVYNHLNVYGPEVQKRSGSNSQNMDFIYSSNTSSEKSEVPTVQGASTASAQVPTVSTDVATSSLSYDTFCAFIATQPNGSQTGKKITIQGSDVAGFDKSKVECFNCHKMGHFARECRSPRSQDRGKRESYKKNPNVEEPAPKTMIAINGIGWDWSYMVEEDKALKNHAFVANKEEVPTEYALMAKSSSSSDNEVYDHSFCSKSCRKNTENLNTKTSKLNEELSDCETELYNYKRGSQKLDKDMKGVGFNEYCAVSPPPAQVYSPSKKGLSWVGLSEFVDDTVTDYSRTTPSIDVSKSVSKEHEERWKSNNLSFFEQGGSSSNVVSKLMIKFMKESGCPNATKVNNTKNARKSTMMYAEMYKNSSQSPRGIPQDNIDDKGYWDNGCSRHMTRNISYLSEYEPFNGGYVSFGHGRGKITGKGSIKAGKDFKLVEDKHVLLKTPRQQNMYTIDLKNVVPHKNLTCLIAKASVDESMLWHRRLGHLKFKTMNKLVRSNLDNGLPSKSFENDHSCVACLKGKQHKASFVVTGTSSTNISGTKEDEAVKEKESPLRFIALPNWFHEAQMVTSKESAKKDDTIPDNNAPQKVQKEVNGDKEVSKSMETGFPIISTPDPTDSLSIPLVTSSIPRIISNGRSSFLEPLSLGNAMSFKNRLEDFFRDTSKAVSLNDVVADLSNMETAIQFSLTPSLMIHKDHPKSQIISPVDTPIQTRQKTKNVDVQSFIAIIHQKTNPYLLHYCLFSCFLSQEEPKKIVDALKDLSWVEAMQQELLQFKIQNVWVWVDCPSRVRPIGMKWVLKNKKDKKGIVIRKKARLVAQGHTQEEGIDYEEVFAPVARIKAIRLFLAYASYMGFTVYQMDVKSASLYGTIDEEDGTGKDVELHLYRSMIRSLMYLTASRPDIMFAVCACARHQVTPNECHLYAVKRIFRYLKGNPKLGLWYPKESPFDLVAYLDSDYGGANQDRKSTTRGYDNVADILTKAFDVRRFQYLVVSIGMLNPYNVYPLIIFVKFRIGFVLLSDQDPVVNMCLNFIHGSDSEQRTYEFMHIYLASKTEHNTDFHQIVDFLEASHIRLKQRMEKQKFLLRLMADPNWVEAMQEELLQFKIQNVWTLVDCLKGLRPIGTKWVLKNKKDERGIVIRNKAKLVAQRHTQEEGIDYDEVFAPIARIKAIRLFLAYASFMGFTVYQMDVKSAFLYGTIDEEVYVMQSPGFQDPEFPAKVYKVEKAMYGLHQAPRAWYGTLSKYLLKNGFQRGTIDQTLFIRKQREDFILVRVYVDDIIFRSSNPQLCRELEALMHEKFQMSAMGELNFFLGLQVLQKEDGIFLLQDKYVGDILKIFGYSDVRHQVTPKECHLHAVKRIFRYLKGHPKLRLWYPKESPFDLVSFSDSDYDGATQDRKSTTGGLSMLWEALSREFSTSILRLHQVTPKECHLHAVKRIFRYLKGHPKLRLWYPKESPFDLVSFSDSDYDGATQDRKSTTGGLSMLWEALSREFSTSILRL
nr:hypothetical protein [Tanacetum cinerariifolium]